MELERLTFFFRVAESGSFSEAAEALYTTQSSVSKQIARLERDLGAQLFERRHRKAVLTPAGERLLPEARALMEQYERMLKAVRYQPALLHIAVLPVLGYYGFSERLRAFTERHPEIKILLSEEDNATLKMLSAGKQCDAAIYRTETTEELQPHSITLGTDELALLVWEGHPLAHLKEPVPLKEFSEERFLLLNAGTDLRGQSIRLCRRAGFEPRVVYTGASGETIAGLVKEKMGVAMIMGQVAKRHVSADVRAVRVWPTAEFRMVFSLSAQGYGRPEARMLREYLAEDIRKKEERLSE